MTSNQVPPHPDARTRILITAGERRGPVVVISLNRRGRDDKRFPIGVALADGVMWNRSSEGVPGSRDRGLLDPTDISTVDRVVGALQARRCALMMVHARHALRRLFVPSSDLLGGVL